MTSDFFGLRLIRKKKKKIHIVMRLNIRLTLNFIGYFSFRHQKSSKLQERRDDPPRLLKRFCVNSYTFSTTWARIRLASNNSQVILEGEKWYKKGL